MLCGLGAVEIVSGSDVVICWYTTESIQEFRFLSLVAGIITCPLLIELTDELAQDLICAAERPNNTDNV
jgi:hypothetical protein